MRRRTAKNFALALRASCFVAPVAGIRRPVRMRERRQRMLVFSF